MSFLVNYVPWFTEEEACVNTELSMIYSFKSHVDKTFFPVGKKQSLAEAPGLVSEGAGLRSQCFRLSFLQAISSARTHF